MAMVEMWRHNQTSADVDLSISDAIDGLDQTTQLTVYRVVQEGLTNAFRHSGADRISVQVAVDGSDAGHGEKESARRCVEVVVRDNGRGRAEPPRDGFGLRAMRERVSALSGTLSLSSQKTAGTELRVQLPLFRQQAPSEHATA